jgi:monoamine oxidase
MRAPVELVGNDALTRRRFIGTGAAAGAGALFGTALDAEAAKRRKRRAKRKRGRLREADVVVVGAGLAGLTAAREIVRADKSVLLLEARDRVGGRVHNHELGGGKVSEAGGTFAGPTQNHILALARELGIGTFETYNQGENVYMADGSRLTYSDQSPLGTAPPDPVILGDLATVVAQLDDMATRVPVDAPWDAAEAGAWDRQTLEHWIRENSTTDRFRRLVPAATRPIFGAEPRHLSLLFTLFYIAASGDEKTVGTFERNFNTRDGAQMFRFHGGSGLIALRLAERIGKRILLNAPARRIVQEKRRVVVHHRRDRVRARRAILALPPPLTEGISFEPALPGRRAELAQKLPQGELIKVAAVYDKPFWRDKGLTGTAVSLDGPVNATFDDSPPDGSPGVVFGFVGGDEARKFQGMSSADRRAAVLKNFSDFFGPEGGSPREYFETDWPAERWSRGGPVGIAGQGTMLSHAPLIREPTGKIHWAGTETSTYWNGYMDGAVRSGKRAAREVLDEL